LRVIRADFSSIACVYGAEVESSHRVKDPLSSLRDTFRFFRGTFGLLNGRYITGKYTGCSNAKADRDNPRAHHKFQRFKLTYAERLFAQRLATQRSGLELKVTSNWLPERAAWRQSS
jgi:hypothetical protein